MLILMGYTHLDPSDVKEFTADVQTVISGTRAEKGCLFYAFTVEDESAGRMLTVQRWQDQASLSAHVKRHESAPFLKKWGSRMSMEVMKYNVSEENAEPSLHSPTS